MTEKSKKVDLETHEKKLATAGDLGRKYGKAANREMIPAERRQILDSVASKNVIGRFFKALGKTTQRVYDEFLLNEVDPEWVQKNMKDLYLARRTPEECAADVKERLDLYLREGV